MSETGEVMRISGIVAWQNAVKALPAVWTVRIRFEGQDEDTGDLYDSKEAAEVDARWRNEHGHRARVVRLSGVMSLALSRWRWLDEEPQDGLEK